MSHALSSLNLLNEYSTIDERIPLIVSGLDEEGTGILAAQEVLRDALNPQEIYPPLDEAFAAAGFVDAVFGMQHEGAPSGNAVFYRPERYLLLDAGSIPLAHEPALRWQPPEAVYAVLRPLDEPGQDLIVISAHFAWGGPMAGARLVNAQTVNARANELAAEHDSALVFMAGDFNETPNGAATTFLTGRSAAPAGEGAFWIDTWEWLRPGETGATQDPAGHYATLTAATVGVISTGNIPARRIDYILLREWSYERLGVRPEVKLWGTPADGEVSDHFGLTLNFSR